jgi:hypothetical protein
MTPKPNIRNEIRKSYKHDETERQLSEAIPHFAALGIELKYSDIKGPRYLSHHVRLYKDGNMVAQFYPKRGNLHVKGKAQIRNVKTIAEVLSYFQAEDEEDRRLRKAIDVLNRY